MLVVWSPSLLSPRVCLPHAAQRATVEISRPLNCRRISSNNPEQFQRSFTTSSLQEDSDTLIEQRFYEIVGLYNERIDNRDKLALCISKARTLLAYVWLPWPVILETLIVLGAALPSHDWDAANGCQIEAEHLWRVDRLYYPEGQDKEDNDFLALVRKD